MARESPSRARILHFDLDGTIHRIGTGRVKPALAGGGLEEAVRASAFDRLECVGSFAGVAHAMASAHPGYDAVGTLFRLCGGAFRDEGWFRAISGLCADPRLRAAGVALDSDWWYMDDQASRYFTLAGRHDVLVRELGARILEPAPAGDGADVLAWLARIPSAPAS